MKKFLSLLEESNLPENWESGEDYLNIAYIIENTTYEGLGNRLSIWLQGCNLGCKGCSNYELWDFKPVHIVKVNRLLEYILSIKNSIEGITISGGEPLLQAKAVRKLLEGIKSKTDLTVMLYTGYEIEEITDIDATKIINLSDVVITGRFIEEKKDIFLRWGGSSNQKIIFNNDDYRKKYESDNIQNTFEIHIDNINEDIFILGFPDRNLIKEFEK